jgi:hypothetical protein
MVAANGRAIACDLESRIHFMTTRPSFVLLLALGLPGVLGCSQAGFVPESTTMPAARAGLRPEFRIFYDSLIEHGDWTLIEPHGFVFRPRVNAAAWRPYDDGFWVPTDLYGWVWVSSEPFGWATYHYGRWLYDVYRGWVWVPGLDWGPAWVTWYTAGDYVGWSPRMVPGSGTVPGGPITFISASRLATPNLSEIKLTRDQLGEAGQEVQRIDHQIVVEGVTVPAGPRIQDIERKTGPLKRVRIEDLVAPVDVASLRAAGKTAPGGEVSEPPEILETAESTRQAGEQAARDARLMVGSKRVGSSVPIVRPFGGPGTTAPAKPARPPDPKKPATAAAPADTSR